MKVNLLINNPAGIRPDCMNIDPTANGSDSRVQDDLYKLSTVDDAECEELIAMDIVDYLEPKGLDELITGWVKKLKHNGILTIGFMDMYQMCKVILGRLVELEQANYMLHGTGVVRRSTMSMNFVAALLTEKGLKVLSKRIVSCKAIIKAVRP